MLRIVFDNPYVAIFRFLFVVHFKTISQILFLHFNTSLTVVGVVGSISSFVVSDMSGVFCFSDRFVCDCLFFLSRLRAQMPWCGISGGVVVVEGVWCVLCVLCVFCVLST